MFATSSPDLPFVALALACATLALACEDPVHSDAVGDLGPETPGVPEGPTHRPGQPCTTCHGGDGPGDSELVAAGTVFRVRGTADPLVGAVVTVIDANGDSRTASSNEVGNFFIRKTDWSPTFPLRASLDAEGTHKEMVTTIGRDGGCAACHRGAGSAEAMPGVFLKDP